MPTLDINDVGSIGEILEIPAYLLPPEAWSYTRNVRSHGGSMRRLDGWSRTFGTPPVAPHFLLVVESVTQPYWIYTSLTKAYVWDGTSHSNITRQSDGVDVDYSTTATRQWNGTVFSGIPIINNSVDVPQYWGAFDTSTRLTALSNWNTNHRAKKLVSFGPFLVAIHITKSSTVYPHMVKWSSSATSPGSLPSSWDETDPTNDAGEYDLTDVSAGLLLDVLGLGANLLLYKEHSTWIMRYVGGRAIFGFDTLFSTSGVLTERCVTATGDGRRHIVVTQDDIIMHSGTQEVTSLLSKRMRKELFNRLDTVNYINSFVFTDPTNDEVWFCYPESGQEYPNMAVIINYKNGCVTEADGISFRNVASGRILEASPFTWNSITATWDSLTWSWSTQDRNRIIAASSDNTCFYKLNDGLTRDGINFEAVLQRTGLSLVGRKRNGEWIENFEVRKFCNRLFPKARGGPIQVRVGAQTVVDGPVEWGTYQEFDPSTSIALDVTLSGRAICLEFRTSDSVDWLLDGYRISIEDVGRF